MAEVNSNKESPFIYKYSKTLLKRVYRPIKPLINPLIKKIQLFHVFILLLAVSVLGNFHPAGRAYQAQENLARWPWSTKAHSQIALAYFNHGQEQLALQELQLARQLLILKTPWAESSLKNSETIINQPEKIRQEISSWEKVLATRPGYRDILLKMALLNWQLYQNDQALDNWKKANYLDPNNSLVEAVGKIISFQL